MRLYRDRAVVLRQHKLGEADRIVTLLTREHGLVRAVAKGVRRTRSKFGSRLEPFAHIDVQLHPGPQPRHRHPGAGHRRVRQPTSSATTAATPAHAPCWKPPSGWPGRNAPRRRRCTGSPSGRCVRWPTASGPRELVLDAYLLRAMGIAGWAPSLIECARCAAARPAPRVPRRRRRQRVRALPAVRFGHSAAGGAGSDGCAARRRLGDRRGVDTVVSQPGQRFGGRAPAVAPRTSAADIAAGRARLSD